MKMFNVKLTGHEYRYELFQILNLFYDKSEINFNSEDLIFDFESLVNNVESYVEFIAKKQGEEPISEKKHIDINDKKAVKNAIRFTALKCLEKYTSSSKPWGILVGIRPTKIVHECVKNGMGKGEIISYLVSNYSLTHEKAELTLEVAFNEAKFLNKKPKSLSLYIGIPFCPTRCVYCSFTSNPIGGNKGFVDKYLESLHKEIDASLSQIKKRGYSVDTLYIGGGTPTSLTAEQISELLSILGKHLDLKNLREFTVEAGRPDSIDREKLIAIKEAGCSRISINPQSMNDETLKRIGRLHSSKEIIDKFYMARELGFDNINMDIIIGLPGEGLAEIERTIDIICDLSPENVTVHTMAIKRASVLIEEEHERESEIAEDMYKIAIERVRKAGMYPYYMYRQKNMVSPLENIGYCKEDKECVYNIQMIAENISIIAMGADAVSKLMFEKENRHERVANLKDVREYVNRIDEMIKNKVKAIDMLE
jgi:coproporphyrinogen dehydrogenase HemZ